MKTSSTATADFSCFAVASGRVHLLLQNVGELSDRDLHNCIVLSPTVLLYSLTHPSIHPYQFVRQQIVEIGPTNNKTATSHNKKLSYRRDIARVVPDSFILPKTRLSGL